jgi:ubiquinone/menaquinone biosynthesis C-methylase UbiE
MTSEKECWDKIYSENNKAWKHNEFAENALEQIRLNKLKKLLEIGFGDGRDTLFFSDAGLDITAIDFSSVALERLKQTINKNKIKNINCLEADVSTGLKNFKSEEFDAAYAHLTLHFFDDKTTEKIFSEIYKLLKKHGLFFIKVKSTDDPLYGKGTLIEKDMFGSDHIRHFFSEEYMREMLKGFKIVSLEKETGEYNGKSSSFIAAVAKKN